MKTILVAEDNESNYKLMTYILRKEYNYMRAVNGEDAVRKVAQGGIDLVLMDISMPVMDGLEATKLIIRDHPEVPVVAVTANAFESDKRRALQAGCKDFLSKPVNGAECLKVIGQLLEKK
jgi:CheY-like chemotaxis protein